MPIPCYFFEYQRPSQSVVHARDLSGSLSKSSHFPELEEENESTDATICQISSNPLMQPQHGPRVYLK